MNTATSPQQPTTTTQPRKGPEQTVWGVDYHQTRRRGHVHGERWLSVLTRLNDGKLLFTWHSQRRPGTKEMRQLLGRGLVKSRSWPDALWCDTYLAQYAGPWAEHYGLRLHVRCVPPVRVGNWYEMRLERTVRGRDAGSPAQQRAEAREAAWEAELRGILTGEEVCKWNLDATEGWLDRLFRRIRRFGSQWGRKAL